jgi:hypothetical protein
VGGHQAANGGPPILVIEGSHANHHEPGPLEALLAAVVVGVAIRTPVIITVRLDDETRCLVEQVSDTKQAPITIEDGNVHRKTGQSGVQVRHEPRSRLPRTGGTG